MPRRAFIRGSNSRLERFEDCPSSFRKQYLDKIPAPRATALVRGVAFHAFAEAYVKHCIDAGVESDTPWGEIKALEFLQGLGEEEAEDVARINAQFLRHYRVERPEDHVGVESGSAFDRHWCAVDWNDRRRVYFRFRLDHVLWESHEARAGEPVVSGTAAGEGGDGDAHGARRILVIEDFKSDRVIERHQTVGTSKQLKRYALAAALMWPDKVGPAIKVRLYYARFGATREAHVGMEQLPFIRDEIDARMEEIQSERKWEPKAGPHCAFCSYTTRCELFKEIWGWGPLKLETHMEAEKAAKDLMFIRGLEKTYTERLRAWSRGHGDLDLGDGSRLGFVPVERVLLGSGEDVVRALKELGVSDEGCRKAVRSTKDGIEAALATLGRGKKKQLLPEVLAKVGKKDVQVKFQRFKDKEAHGLAEETEGTTPLDEAA